MILNHREFWPQKKILTFIGFLKIIKMDVQVPTKQSVVDRGKKERRTTLIIRTRYLSIEKMNEGGRQS